MTVSDYDVSSACSWDLSLLALGDAGAVLEGDVAVGLVCSMSLCSSLTAWCSWSCTELLKSTIGPDPVLQGQVRNSSCDKLR